MGGCVPRSREGWSALRKQYNFNGQEVWGEEVEFETEREGWNVYILHDGTKLKMKSIVSQVIRLEMHNPANGDPLYLVQASNVLNTDSPENLKKREG
jgi:hypothetical protein